MSSWKPTLLAVLLSSSLVAGFLYYQGQKQETQAARLRYENGLMKFQAYQRLHGQAEPASPTLSANSTGLANTSAGANSALGYHNEGFATPQASLQTFVWACDQGDTETVAKMLFIESEDRQRAEAFFNSLPEKVRSKWKSVDEMAATLLIMRSMARSFPSSEILRATLIEKMGERRASCNVPYQVEFEKTDEGWKFVITARTFELLERELSTAFGAITDT